MQTRNADHTVSCSRGSADRQTAFPQKNRRNKNSHTEDQKGQEPEACPKTRGFPTQQSPPHIHMARHKVNFIKNLLTGKIVSTFADLKTAFNFLLYFLFSKLSYYNSSITPYIKFPKLIRQLSLVPTQTNSSNVTHSNLWMPSLKFPPFEHLDFLPRLSRICIHSRILNQTLQAE